MLIKEEIFRNLFTKLIVIKDKEFAQRQAKTLELESIIGDEDLDSDEISYRLENYKLSNDVNSIIVFPYVDHSAGLSFLLIATSYIENDNLFVYKRKDFTVLSNFRKDIANDLEFEYLNNLKVNDDFDIEYYNSYIKDIFPNYNSTELLSLRLLEILDDCRNEDYPDDILVIFFKKDLQPEGMWVRYEKMGEGVIDGVLLNQPNQDMGVNKGETITFGILEQEDGTFVCICNLDKDN